MYKFVCDSAKNMYMIGNNCLHMGAEVRWSGDEHASASYGTSIPSTTAAWSTGVSVGDIASISYTLPPYYTADFSASGLDYTGSSINDKTVTVTGRVVNDVDFGFSNYRANTFSASGTALSIKYYGDDSLHPAYAWVHQFQSSAVMPSYAIKSEDMTISAAWHTVNLPADYDIMQTIDVSMPFLVANKFAPPVESASVYMTAEIPYTYTTYTGATRTGMPIRYLFGSNGNLHTMDWSNSVAAANPQVPGDWKVTVSASADLSTSNVPVSSLYGWAEQTVHSSQYLMLGGISATALITGYVR